MPAPHPRMHGLSHVPGGPDPIPGLVIQHPNPPYEDVVQAIPDLVSYWRMGEPAGDQLDYAENPVGDMPLDPDFSAGDGEYKEMPGAPVDENDGAFSFLVNTDTNNYVAGDLFSANDTADHRWGFGSSSPFTVAFWFKVNVGWDLPDDAAPPLMVGTANGLQGWGVLITPVAPTEEDPQQYRLQGVRALSAISSTVVTGTADVDVIGTDIWCHAAMVYDGTLLKLFLNAGQVDEASSVHGCSPLDVIRVGGGSPWSGPGGSTGPFNYLYGSIDEVAVWSVPLTDFDIGLLAETADPPTSSLWSHGTGAPDGANLADYYLDVTTGDIWNQKDLVWTKIWDAP